MEVINGHKNEAVPFSGLEKISDLMEYDGPILSHFKDKRGKDYLFYWVDYDQNYNRWLLWKISDFQLYQYLKGLISLHDLLTEDNKEFVYSLDIGEDLSYSNITFVEIENLPDSYIPEIESFYSFPIDPAYDELIEKYESNYYLSILREKAIYYTLNPSDSKFSTTVSAESAGNFLRKISSSFLSFLEFDFYTNFKLEFEDLDKLYKTATKLKSMLCPRVVDLEYGSFSVALSTDTMVDLKRKIFKPWQKEILDKFKKDVVNIDYSSEDDINILVQKYPEDIRRKIYSPILDVINDKSYSIEVSDFKRSFKRNYKKTGNKEIKKLVPKTRVEEKEEENRRLLNLILEVHEGEDLSKIGKRELQTGLLFSEEVDKVIRSFSELRYLDYLVILAKKLDYELHLENNVYTLINSLFNITVKGKDRKQVIEAFSKEFIERYLKLLEDQENENISEEFKIYQEYVQELTKTSANNLE